MSALKFKPQPHPKPFDLRDIREVYRLLSEVRGSAKPRSTTLPIRLVKKKRTPFYCSFCGKEQDEVGYLVAGANVFICNECVELCREIGTEMLVVNQPPQPIGREDRLRNALTQLVGWVEECGSNHAGRDYALTEARAALKGFTILTRA